MEPQNEFWTALDCLSLVFRKHFHLTRKASSISGMGVFTEVDIPRGTILAVSTDKIDNSDISSMFNDGDFTYPSTFDKDTLIQTLEQYKSSDKSNIRVVKTNTEDFFIYKANRDIKAGEELTRKYGIQKWSFWLTIHVSLNDGIITVDDLKTIKSSKHATPNSDDKKQIQNGKIQALIEAWKHFGYDLSVTNTQK